MIRIGVLGTANIAFRRMIPAIKKTAGIEYAGVAVAAPSEWTEAVGDEEGFRAVKLEKAQSFAEAFGGKVYEGYEELLKDPSIDAVYIPLPPSHHEEWSRKAISYGKHILVEKPFTLSEKATRDIAGSAMEKGLAFCENYGFVIHPQFACMKKILDEGRIGEFRLMRSMFSFPFRDASDFRYKKEYGGGALLDCGGYVIRAAEALFGDGLTLKSAVLHDSDTYGVDIYGDATFETPDGKTAQLSFGMDNAYSCQIELFGSTGMVSSPRAFTAPGDFAVKLSLNDKGNSEMIEIEPFDQFAAVVERFIGLVENEDGRGAVRDELVRHAALVDEVMKKAERFACK